MTYLELTIAVLAMILACICVIAWRISPLPPSPTILDTNKPKRED